MICTQIYTASWRCFNSNAGGRAKPVFVFDLQLFNGEKTEEATAKRKSEARQKGQVAKSAEMNSAFIILAAFFALKVTGSYIYQQLSDYMRSIFTNINMADMTIMDLQALFLTFGLVFLKTALPIMISILIISLAINFLQVGFIFTLEPLMPDFGKLNPLTGFQRLFSKRAFVELIKSLIKVCIIGYFIYRFITQEVLHVPEFITFGLNDSLQVTASMVLSLAFQIGEIMIVVAALDYGYQWWDHNQSLKMSKQEVKDEFKQSEGNPQIKGKIKERQRAIAMRRMMQEVPKASVVVTNPTHFAVALKYEKNMTAPVIVAKGQDFMAHRIKEIANEHRVVIVENKPLARSLYANAEVGETVPPELYQAVAEVLAYVYRLKKRLS